MRIGLFNLGLNPLEMALDHDQQIVEIMGNAARQLTDRLHLLSMAQLILQLLALCHIFGKHLHVDNLAAFIANGTPSEADGQLARFRMPPRALETLARS